MAELHVVKKKKSPLPWVLLALLLLGLIAYFFLRAGNPTNTDVAVPADSTISYDSSGQGTP